MAAKIEPAALDSNIFQLAAFGLLDGLKNVVEGPDHAAAADEEKKDEEVVNKVDVDAVDDRGCSPMVWASR